MILTVFMYVINTLSLKLLFWSSDGTTQALGTCLRDFRNKPYPIRAKITYYKKTLTVRRSRNLHSLMLKSGLCVSNFWAVLSLHLSPQVMLNNGFTPDKEDYEFCTRVDNMILPSEGFFGISAATGGLAGKKNKSIKTPNFLLISKPD